MGNTFRKSRTKAARTSVLFKSLPLLLYTTRPATEVQELLHILGKPILLRKMHLALTLLTPPAASHKASPGGRSPAIFQILK